MLSDYILGLGIILASLLFIALWKHERGSDASFTDPYVLLNLGIAAIAGGMTYLGFFDTLQSVMGPVSDALVNAFGIPDRWTNNGMGAARYTPTDVLRVLVVIPVFLYASYRDVKERIVRNWVWYPLFGHGLVFLAYDLYTGSPDFLAPWILGNLLFALALGYVLFKTRLFGGADMKAMWGLGIILPTYPAIVVAPRVLPPLLSTPHNAMNMFALTILANTALVAMCWPIYTLFRNVKNGDFDVTRPGLMLTARRVPLRDSITEHGKILPVWTFDAPGPLSRVKALVLTVSYGFDTKFLSDYLSWHNEVTNDDITDPTDINRHRVERFLKSDANKDENGNVIWHADDTEESAKAFTELLEQDVVWMTPGIPFIIPMFLGLLLSLTVGDIVYWLVLALN